MARSAPSSSQSAIAAGSAGGLGGRGQPGVVGQRQHPVALPLSLALCCELLNWSSAHSTAASARPRGLLRRQVRRVDGQHAVKLEAHRAGAMPGPARNRRQQLRVGGAPADLPASRLDQPVARGLLHQVHQRLELPETDRRGRPGPRRRSRLAPPAPASTCRRPSFRAFMVRSSIMALPEGQRGGLDLLPCRMTQ
jgi:hypothetical protein